MDIRVVVKDDGTVTVFSETGTFEEGKKVAAELFSKLQAAGLQMEVGQAEQHRHDDDKAHTHTHEHQH